MFITEFSCVCFVKFDKLFLPPNCCHVFKLVIYTGMARLVIDMNMFSWKIFPFGILHQLTDFIVNYFDFYFDLSHPTSFVSSLLSQLGFILQQGLKG